MKKIIYLIMLVLLVSVVCGASYLDICEDSARISGNCTMITPALTDCSIYNYSIINSTGGLKESDNLTLLYDDLYYFNFSLGKGEYVIRLCDGAMREVIVEGEDDMASLAVTIFVSLITLGIFILPILIKHFSSNKYLDHTLKNCCIVIGLFLLSMDTAMVATIADNADLGISKILFRYLWLINWTAYFAIVIVIISFVYRIFTEWSNDKKKRSMGENEI